MMALASHYAPRIAMPNLMLLAAVAAIPFFTAFASQNPATRVPVVCYCGWLLLTALLNRRLQALVYRAPVVDERATAGALATGRARSDAVILGCAGAAVAGYLLPPIGQVVLATIPIWRLLLVRLRPRAVTAARGGAGGRQRR